MPLADGRPTRFYGRREQFGACGVASLLVAFFSGDESPIAVVRTDAGVQLTVDSAGCELSREEAAAVRAAIGDALRERTAFFRTVGERRPDGRYVVSRRAAESTGNQQVFDDFEALCALYDGLPRRFGADAVGEAGVTGSRRHLLVRHFAEHPAFDCSLVRERPLTAEKERSESDTTVDDAADGR